MARPVSSQAKALALAAGKVGARNPPKAVEQIVNGRRLTRDQALALHQAARLAKGTSADRRKARAIVRSVEQQIVCAAEAEMVGRGVAETVQLMGGEAADIRHEEAEEASFVRDGDGCLVRHQGELVVRVEKVVRVRRDDGLVNLYASGSLSVEQYEIGQLYRLISAKAAPSTGSSLNERSGGGVTGTSDRAVWAALERAYASLRLRLVRAAVADERTHQLLDAVAGRGETIRSLVSGGDARKRAVSQLGRALLVAGPLLRVTDAQLRRGLANQGR